MLNFSSTLDILIGEDQDGSLSVGCSEGSCKQQNLTYKLQDMLELSVGPRDNYDGIRSCFTYNPPGRYKPGYQGERAVSILELILMLNQLVNQFFLS